MFIRCRPYVDYITQVWKIVGSPNFHSGSVTISLRKTPELDIYSLNYLKELEATVLSWLHDHDSHEM